MRAVLVKLLELVEGLAVLRPLAREDLVEREAQRVDVALDRCAFASELLRRHVLQRAGELVGRLARSCGNAEVGDADVPVAVDHHVGGFEIAMQHAALVCGGDARTELPRDLHCLVVRNAPDATEQRSQIFSVDILHRQEAAALRFAEVVQTTDVLVRDLTRDAKLVVKLAEACVAVDGRNFSATG